MVKKSQESLREKLRSKNTFFKSTNIRHVRPMFSVSWCPMLAAFSYLLESTDDPEVRFEGRWEEKREFFFTFFLSIFMCRLRSCV